MISYVFQFLPLHLACYSKACCVDSNGRYADDACNTVFRNKAFPGNRVPRNQITETQRMQVPL
jgi:hypothetical protein